MSDSTPQTSTRTSSFIVSGQIDEGAFLNRLSLVNKRISENKNRASWLDDLIPSLAGKSPPTPPPRPTGYRSYSLKRDSRSRVSKGLRKRSMTLKRASSLKGTSPRLPHRSHSAMANEARRPKLPPRTLSSGSLQQLDSISDAKKSRSRGDSNKQPGSLRSHRRSTFPVSTNRQKTPRFSRSASPSTEEKNPLRGRSSKTPFAQATQKKKVFLTIKPIQWVDSEPPSSLEGVRGSGASQLNDPMYLSVATTASASSGVRMENKHFTYSTPSKKSQGKSTVLKAANKILAGIGNALKRRRRSSKSHSESRTNGSRSSSDLSSISSSISAATIIQRPKPPPLPTWASKSQQKSTSQVSVTRKGQKLSHRFDKGGLKKTYGTYGARQSCIYALTASMDVSNLIEKQARDMIEANRRLEELIDLNQLNQGNSNNEEDAGETKNYQSESHSSSDSTRTLIRNISFSSQTKRCEGVSSLLTSTAATCPLDYDEKQGRMYRLAVTTGDIFLKHGRSGTPHRKIVVVENGRIYWLSLRHRRAMLKRAASYISLNDIKEICIGRTTSVFQRNIFQNPNSSYYFSFKTNERTLDLETSEKSKMELWVKAVSYVQNLEIMGREK
mmetsp:Transcript_24439/g.33961  ORF Transcript_24439/g.33961 Transcript_24439/m.33961 type:complete len:613 (-) Transcript_24439:122-1960(-)